MPTSPALEFKDVGFSYSANGAPVLDGLNLTVGVGELFVLVGASGSGKTTALSLAAGFDHPTVGEILVDGRSVTGPGPDRVVIFQGEDSLLGWLNVSQNVEFGLKVARVPRQERSERVVDALRMVELWEQRKKRPHELSGGMKQRVQIARALVSDARILLMDEPFGALDALTRTSLQDQFLDVWQGSDRSVLFITHDLAEAVLLGDRIGVLSQGPGARMSQVTENELQRPRRRGDVAFAAKYQELEEAVVAARSGPPGRPSAGQRRGDGARYA